MSTFTYITRNVVTNSPASQYFTFPSRIPCVLRNIRFHMYFDSPLTDPSGSTIPRLANLPHLLSIQINQQRNAMEYFSMGTSSASGTDVPVTNPEYFPSQIGINNVSRESYNILTTAQSSSLFLDSLNNVHGYASYDLDVSIPINNNSMSRGEDLVIAFQMFDFNGFYLVSIPAIQWTFDF